MGDHLDEFRSPFDNDDFDSDDEGKADQLFSKYTSAASTKASAKTVSDSQQQQKLTFEALFGSPIKQKPAFQVKENEKLMHVTTAEAQSKLPRSYPLQLQNEKFSPASSQFQTKNTQVDLQSKMRLAQSSANNNLLVDPHSKLRLTKTSISIYSDEYSPIEKSLKDRNISTPFLPLGSSSIAASKNFWTTCVLVRKAGVRQSSKGNDYGIWELNDLHNLELNWTLFLFGTTATAPELLYIGLGSIIDLVNPSILDDSASSSASTSTKKGYKFSINKTNQIRFIGKAHDFGYCESRRKDGKPCTVVVNSFICPVCIHHASSELRKSLKSTKSKKTGLNKSKSFNVEYSNEVEWNRRKGEGIVTTDFTGKSPSLTKIASFSGPVLAAVSVPVRKSLCRMELQDYSAVVKRSPIQLGNHASISFPKEDKNSGLLSIPKCDRQLLSASRKPLELDPLKTRHLTEKDRKILEALNQSGSSSKKPDKEDKLLPPNMSTASDLPSLIASSTNAGSRNMLHYFNAKNKTEELKRNSEEFDNDSSVDKAGKGKVFQVDGGPLIMTRETLQNMKKALNYVKQIGPIKKVDPNSIPRIKPDLNSTNAKKRKLSEGEDLVTKTQDAKVSKLGSENQSEKPCFSGSGTLKSMNGTVLQTKDKLKLTGLNLGQTERSKLMQNEEFLKILNAKSSHAKIAEDIKEDEYFGKLERREAVENKLLSTFSIPTTAVMCRECKYLAVGQSDYCKEKRHAIKIVQAHKRFFQCKDCGQRTMSLDRLPKRTCTNCKNSNWIATSVGKERSGPLLDSEVLSVRGDEEKFLGSLWSGKHVV